MLAHDEALEHIVNCCLEPMDFLEALVRLADSVQGNTRGPVRRSKEIFEVCPPVIITV